MTDSESMIERVARAMFAHEWSDSNRHSNQLPSWDSEGLEAKAYWMAGARAAFEAMREPTEAMISIGANIASTVPIPNTTTRIWRAMIDHILSETAAGGVHDR